MKMKNHHLALLFVLISYFGYSQSLTAKLIDTSNNPIPFATIETAKNKGVISNDEGVFTINLKDVSNNSIEINCLGFSTKKITIKEISANNNIIILEEHINELNQVYISNTKPNADEIIAKVNQNLSNNYNHENQSYNLFFRNTSYMDFNRLEFTIDKASGIRKKKLAGANQSLDSLMQAIKNTKAVHFRDYLANLYIKNKEEAKLDVAKATSLIDKNQNVSIDQIQENAQHLILKYLDTTKTYKLKTGIIKIEDSLELNNSNNESEENKNEYEVNSLKSETHELLYTSQTYENTTLNKIINADLYKYEFIDTTVFNGELVYIIEYFPRRSKAKYTGKIYVTDDSYAVIKIDYAFAKGKRGEKLNLKFLLGIKYVENIKQGTIIFQKNEDNIYQPQYIKQESGNFFYVNRPLKFIENSPSKNKVLFNFLIEGGMREKNEIYFISNSSLNGNDFNNYKEPKTIKYQKLKQYDPEIWKAYNAIEPLEEMKQFKSTED